MRILSRDVWIGLVMMGAAAVYWFEADKIKVSPLDDGIGAAGLPKALAYALAVLAVLLILRAIVVTFMKGAPATAETPVEGPSLGEQLRPHLRAVGMLMIGVGYLPIVNWVGYILAIMALLLAVANFSLFFLGMLVLTPAIWLVNRPKPYLMAAIFALIFSGIYSIDNTLFDLYLVLIAGSIGYVMRLLGFPFLPLVLGLVLGYLIEANYRRSLLLTGGDHAVFINDPISLGLLITALVFVVGSAWRDISTARKAKAEPGAGAGTQG